MQRVFGVTLSTLRAREVRDRTQCLSFFVGEPLGARNLHCA